MANKMGDSVFVPMFLTTDEVDDHLFVDGGATFDYPLLAFGDVGISKTLGLAFAGSSSAAAGDQGETTFGFHQPGEYIHRMLTVLERIQAPLLALYGDLRNQTILIDTGDISSLQFKLSKEDQALLIQNGRKSVRDYFEKDPESYYYKNHDPDFGIKPKGRPG